MATPTLLVPALRPDVAIIHVQRADADGRAHVWGEPGHLRRGGAGRPRASSTPAEEIVPAEIILSDPNRVLAPGVKTLAVVHAPGGAHPAPVQGYYNRDHAYFARVSRAQRARPTISPHG